MVTQADSAKALRRSLDPRLLLWRWRERRMKNRELSRMRKRRVRVYL